MKSVSFRFWSVFVLSIISILLINSNLLFAYEKYERTWEQNYWIDDNPGIIRLPFFDLWDINRFQPTIDSLNPQGSALNSKAATITDYSSCLPNFGKYRDKMLEQAAKQVTYGNGDLYWNCFHYVDDWRNTMELSLVDLEEKEENVVQLSSAIEIKHTEMTKKGLCGPAYSYSGKDECLQVKNMFLLSDEVAKNHEDLQTELQNPFPNMQSYSYYLSSSKEAIRQLESADSLIEQGTANAESEYSTYLTDSETQKKTVENKISALDEQQIDLITSNPTSTSVGSLTTVAKTFEQLKDKKAASDINFDNAKKLHENTDTINYLADSIGKMDKTKSDYIDLVQRLTELNEYAQKTVDQKKAEAKKELDLAAAAVKNGGGSDAIKSYEDAKKAFELAQKDTTLGSAFVHYLQTTESAIKSQQAETSASEIKNAQKIALLEDLIKRAQADDIPVTTEITTLQKIKENKYPNSDELADEAINSIQSRAQIIYYDLPDLRSQLVSQIALSKQDSFFSDLKNLEKGSVVNGQIIYPDSIGSLKKLSFGYQNLLAQLKTHSKDILGTTLEARGTIIVSNVKLDQPVLIILNVLFANPLSYGGENIPTRAKLDSNFDFFYSDIQSGKEFVRSVKQDGNDLVFVLSKVEPYGTYQLALQKVKTIAQTISTKSSAMGIENDQAKVKTSIDFEATDSFRSLDQSYGPYLIDGSKPSIITKGKHTLSSEKTVADAYKFETKNLITKDGNGAKQFISYEIAVTANMDLDSIVAPLSNLDGTSISNLKISSSNSDSIKVQSGKSVVLTLGKLVAGQKITLTISYEVDDSKTYVENKIKELGQTNLSSNAKSIYEEAIKKAASGDYKSALALIESAILTNEKDKKDSFKSSAKLDELLKKLNSEISDLSIQTNLSHSFIPKILKRKSALETIRDSLKSITQTDQIAILSKVDFTFLPKELSELKKNISKDYKNLAERYFKIGKAVTPTEFVVFENDFENFDRNQTVHTGVQALESLEIANELTKKAESEKGSISDILDSSFQDLKSRLNQLDNYFGEAEEAKGTDYSKLFSEDKKQLTTKLSDLENARSDERTFWPKYKELNNSANKMQKTLDSFKSESDAKIKLLDQALSLSNFDANKKKDLSDKLDKIKKSNSGGHYIAAIKSSILLLREFESSKGDNSYIWLILLIVVALGGIIYLYLQQQKQSKPKELKPLLKVKQEI